MVSYSQIVDMLKFLTQKLKNQSLAEVCPMSVTENWIHSPQNLQKSPTPVSQVDIENCDKAKHAVLEEESDEENAEICSITNGLDPAEKESTQSCTEQLHAFQTADTAQTVTTPATSNTTTTTYSPGRTPFRQMNLNNVNHDDCKDSIVRSPQDLALIKLPKQEQQQQQQIGADSGSSSGIAAVVIITTSKNNANNSINLEQLQQQDTLLQAINEDNSSEEELGSINFYPVKSQACKPHIHYHRHHQNESPYPEKRKWSQVSSSNNYNNQVVVDVANVAASHPSSTTNNTFITTTNNFVTSNHSGNNINRSCSNSSISSNNSNPSRSSNNSRSNSINNVTDRHSHGYRQHQQQHSHSSNSTGTYETEDGGDENLDSPGTCDEEVCELVSQPPKPSKFSCSPPRGVPRLRRTVSPKTLFLANVTPVSCDSCWISPRKRQRQSLSEVSPVVIQRPCLDLEKMQKTNLKKHSSHGGSKARLVKIKAYNAMGKSARCMVDPELFTFRSISTYNQLTPVEEPCAL